MHIDLKLNFYFGSQKSFIDIQKLRKRVILKGGHGPFLRSFVPERHYNYQERRNGLVTFQKVERTK